MADIVVQVCDPEKHGDGVNAYVTYEIRTKSSLPNFSSSQFFVRRRYSDFFWLRKTLAEKFPECIVPPLPEKEQLNYLERFAEQFIDHRRSALEIFLYRIIDHPTLSMASDFHTFLEAKVWALETVKGGAGTRMEGFFRSISKDVDEIYRTKVKSNKANDPEHEKFENLRNCAGKEEETLQKVYEISKNLVQHRAETANDLAEFGPAFALLAQSEQELSSAFQKMGQCSDILSTAYRQQSERDRSSLQNPLKEYTLLTNSVKEALRNREVALSKHLDAIQALETHRKELEQARIAVDNPQKKSAFSGFMEKITDETPQQKVTKLEIKIQQDEKIIADSRKDSLDFSARTEREVERYNRIKLHDFRQMLLNYISDQVEFHHRVGEAWASLLPHIETVQLEGAVPPHQLHSHASSSLNLSGGGAASN